MKQTLFLCAVTKKQPPCFYKTAVLFLRKNYASIFAYFAFFSMKSRRGGTSSPISIEKM